VCTATGWTWDYVLWNVDIPRLLALNAHWRLLPPASELLVRIGAVLGLKPRGAAAAAPAQPSSAADADAEFDAELESMPLQPMPHILKPEEYLARKERKREHQ
jgi:hypothetical protein